MCDNLYIYVVRYQRPLRSAPVLFEIVYMKPLQLAAILINIFIYPGIGTFFVGKWVQAIFQLMFFTLGMIFCFTVIGVVIGAPLALIAWVWGIISACSADNRKFSFSSDINNTHT